MAVHTALPELLYVVKQLSTLVDRGTLSPMTKTVFRYTVHKMPLLNTIFIHVYLVTSNFVNINCNSILLSTVISSRIYLPFIFSGKVYMRFSTLAFILHALPRHASSFNGNNICVNIANYEFCHYVISILLSLAVSLSLSRMSKQSYSFGLKKKPQLFFPHDYKPKFTKM